MPYGNPPSPRGKAYKKTKTSRRGGLFAQHACRGRRPRRPEIFIINLLFARDKKLPQFFILRSSSFIIHQKRSRITSRNPLYGNPISVRRVREPPSRGVGDGNPQSSQARFGVPLWTSTPTAGTPLDVDPYRGNPFGRRPLPKNTRKNKICKELFLK